MTALWVVAFVNVCVAVSTCTSLAAAAIRPEGVDTHWLFGAYITQIKAVAFVNIVTTQPARKASCTLTSVASGGASARCSVLAGVANTFVV